MSSSTAMMHLLHYDRHAIATVPDGSDMKSGAAKRIRTPDPLITNQVLYQLSYGSTLLVRPGQFQGK